MTNPDILRHIDEGAHFYLDFFGDAAHMETADHGFYKKIRPKDGEQGVIFIYDLRLENLPDDMARAAIAEIEASACPVWWPLSSKKVQRLRRGGGAASPAPSGDGEFCMALLPENWRLPLFSGTEITQVKTAADFMIWADMANLIFAGGYKDIHPVNHYHWCEKGRLVPYIAGCEGKNAAIAAILNNNGVASLEFVATLEQYRRKGSARAVSAAALRDAFSGGAKIVTLRAFYPANVLYQSLGFQIYH